MTQYILPFKQEDIIAEFGGGQTPIFHPNIDIRRLPGVDIVADFNKPLPIPGESYDGIYSNYNLEHISWRSVNKFLSEIHRILKPGGTAIFITSNLLEQAKVLINTPCWNNNLICMLFGGQRFDEKLELDDQWDNNAHHCGFSPEYITRLLKEVGFNNIKITPIQTDVGPTDMIIEAKKSNSITTMEHNINANHHPFNREYFDGGTYTGIGYQNFPVHYKTSEIILKEKPNSILELGGARGYLTKLFENNNIRSANMEISEHCYHTRATDSLILHDITNTPWPFKNKEFDICFSIATLEHIREEHIPNIIKEMSRVSNRGIHGITFEITPYDVDKTHLSGTIKPKEWWISKFKETSPDYPVKIVDKEEMETGPITVPSSSDNLVKLNIGSFINMNHFGWINVDKLNLSDFAKQNGYIFRQEEVSGHISYENNSVDIITASHFLEHLDRNEGKKFLSECLRVLKPKGIIRLTIPDTELITKKYIDKSVSEYRHVNIGVEKSDDDTQSLYELLLNGHKTVYDYDSLSKLLSRAGFDNIRKMEFGKSNSKEIETQTIDMYPTLSLYIEATPSLGYNDITENVKKDNGRCVTTNNISKNWNILTAGKSEQTQNTQIYNTDKKLRIALISTPFFTVPPKGYSGLEQIVWDLAEGLDELGHIVTIFGPEGSKATKNGHLVITGPSYNTVNVDWFQTEKNAYEKYKDIITPERFQIVHDHTWFAFPYLLKGKYPNLKVLHTQHGGFSWSSPPNW